MVLTLKLSRNACIVIFWFFLVISQLFNVVISEDDNSNPLADLNKSVVGNQVKQHIKIDLTNQNIIEEKCPITCPEIYDPVCAFAGTCFKTFDNPCAVGQLNCDREWYNKFNITYNGVCNPDDKPTCEYCPEVCVKESIPICAYNKFCYQTFYSTCHMFKRNCNGFGRDMFEVFALGKCAEDVHMPICQEFCPQKCEQNFIPVCGKKGKCYKSFYNECFLDQINCLMPNGDLEISFIHAGNCLPDEIQKSEGC